MFIRKIYIENYRTFKTVASEHAFELEFNNPVENETGVTVLCGDNGCGNTSILEAIVLAMCPEDKKIKIDDLSHNELDMEISLYTTTFQVSFLEDKTKKFEGQGFRIRANKRKHYMHASTFADLIVQYPQEIIPLHQDSDLGDFNLLCCYKQSKGYKDRYEPALVLYLDKNRSTQIQCNNDDSNIWNKCMERLSYTDNEDVDWENYRYKNVRKTESLSGAIREFEKYTGKPLGLYMTDPKHHMKNAFIAVPQDKSICRLDRAGDGYAMFFSILWTIYRGIETKKDVIVLLDEPELHLHPKLQIDLCNIIAKYAKKVQFIIATHSPFFVKHLTEADAKFQILSKQGDFVVNRDAQMLLRLNNSLDEIVYLAFDVASETYFDHLYDKACNKRSINDFDKDFREKMNCACKYPSHSNHMNDKNNSNQISFVTYLRNIIHHRDEYGVDGRNFCTHKKLKDAISLLRDYLSGNFRNHILK